jgi:putative SOS response-associated peptidase YedK
MGSSQEPAAVWIYWITTEPNELVLPVHNCMAVILRPEDEEQWLDVSRTFAKARSLLKPLARRVNGCSLCFANRQLSEVRRAGVYPTCFR